LSTPIHDQAKSAVPPGVTIGSTIVAFRKRAGFHTQTQFAVALKKKPGVVSAWETDASLPDLASLLDVCRVLQVTPDSILTAAGLIQPADSSARAVLRPAPGLTLPAPDEESVSDPEFQQVWAKIGAIWKHRKTLTEIQWEALVKNVAAFHQPVEHAQRASGESPRRRQKTVTSKTTR
jgi:transcriptional regulator with XRE-family HTH domain